MGRRSSPVYGPTSAAAFLNSSAGLIEDQFQFKQKYMNSLQIIKQFQAQAQQLSADLEACQEVIATQDQAIQVMQQNDQTPQLQEEVAMLRDNTQKMQLQIDRYKLQLEQKKTQLALLQEKKAETELELKLEKKCLLENFLKIREENKHLSELFNEVQMHPDNTENFNVNRQIN